MEVYITHFNFQYLYGRNVLNASIYDNKDKTLLKSGRLSDLLHEAKIQGYVVVNAQEVLHEVVVVRGFSA